MTAKTKNSGASERDDLPNYDVAIMGRGNSAALTALALAKSGFSVWAEISQTLAAMAKKERPRHGNAFWL